MPYDNNVPQANQTIAGSRPIINGNFAYIDTTLKVEHQFNTGAATQGVHKQCSMANQATPAIPTGTDGVYYIKGSYPFFVNNSVDIRLAGGVSSTNGYAYMGGILLQWGFVSATAATANVLFATANINFPNNCFNVQITPAHQNAAPASVSAISVFANTSSPPAITTTGFTWVRTVSAGNNAFYWLAIGN